MSFIEVCGIIILSLFVQPNNASNTHQIMDLTWDFDNNTIYWKGVKCFGYTKQIAETKQDGSWYAMNEFCAGEHGGTHIDAPYHFHANGWKVGEIPITRLIASGATFDARYLVREHGGSATVTERDLQAWVLLHGKFPKNGVVLFNFGWGQFYSNKTEYFGEDAEGRMNFPGLSAEAATWLVENTEIVGVGVDTPSVDRGASRNYEVHKLFAAKQIYGLENVKMPGNMPVRQFTLFVFPMKLASGTGAPTRIVAIPNEEDFVAGESQFFVVSEAMRVPMYGHLVYVMSICVLTFLLLDNIYKFI